MYGFSMTISGLDLSMLIIRWGASKVPDRSMGMFGSEISVGVGGLDGIIMDARVVVGKDVVGRSLIEREVWGSPGRTDRREV